MFSPQPNLRMRVFQVLTYFILVASGASNFPQRLAAPNVRSVRDRSKDDIFRNPIPPFGFDCLTISFIVWQQSRNSALSRSRSERLNIGARRFWLCVEPFNTEIHAS